MKIAALILFASLAAGCGQGVVAGPKTPTILPGLLNLPVAAGNVLKRCPEDSAKDMTPTSDCVLGPGKNAFKPYEKALDQAGWKEQKNPLGRKAPMHWIAPADANGFVHACLVITQFGTGGGGKEGALLEFRFHDLSTETGASCRPKSA